MAFLIWFMSVSGFAARTPGKADCRALMSAGPSIASLYPEIPTDVLEAFIWQAEDEPDPARRTYRLSYAADERLQHRLTLGLWRSLEGPPHLATMSIGVTLDSRWDRDQFLARIHPLNLETLLDYLNDRRVYIICGSADEITRGAEFLRSLLARARNPGATALPLAP